MVRSPATSVHSIRQGSASASISESITGRAPQQANTRYAVEDLKGIKKFSHKHRQNSRKVLQRWPGWEVNKREPYHAYIHSLVHSGWDNMIELDNYMCEDYEDKDLVVSVLDITDDYKLRRAADIHDEVALTMFLAKEGREGVKVRLFMAEQFGDLASGVMEAFGSALDLDPRFFQWSVYGNNHLLSSSERHRAPFTSLTIPNYTTPLDTEREFFKVSIYILRDDQGDGWTGIILFNSHSKLDLSANILIPPPKYGPSFGKQISRPAAREPQSLRELYLSTFDFIDISEAAKSPFYAVHEILRINTYCWSRVITVVKAEDKRQEAISTEHVEHVEELEKSIRFVRRGGSLGWQFDAADAITTQCKDYLEEDLTHLKEEVDILWERRRRMAAIRERKRDARTNSLTNAFTFFFVPISLVSSIYGMNVSQISGTNTNPNIWQFFVATVGVNIVIIFVLALSNYAHHAINHNRKAGFRECFKFALGRIFADLYSTALGLIHSISEYSIVIVAYIQHIMEFFNEASVVCSWPTV